MSLESDPSGAAPDPTAVPPLGEISTNVARVPHTALPGRNENDMGKLSSDELMYWKAKAMLSPVREESPSPKGPTRRLQPLGPELSAQFSPRGHLIRVSPPREDQCLRNATHGKQPQHSPTKSSVRPLSPGSQKMLNFLQRLERQGLSHD